MLNFEPARAVPFLVAACLAGAASALTGAGGDVPVQLQSSYEAAVRNHSSSPSYVMITVVDEKSKTTRTGCTNGMFLLGAINLEQGVDYGEAERIALANRRHLFRFSKPKALENVSFRYSQAEIDQVRSKLAPLSIQELRDGFAYEGRLHSLYKGMSGEGRAARRDATACVLIERGLSTGIADPSGALWVAK